MWLLGLAIVVLISALIVRVAYRGPDLRQATQTWDLNRMAGLYPAVMGPLAGLAIASSILLITLMARTPDQAFEEVIGGLLLAFLGFVVAAVTYTTTAGLTEDPNQAFSVRDTVVTLYVLANAFVYLSLVGSWVVLPTMLATVNLPTLSQALTWVALCLVLGGAVWQAVWLSNLRLTGISSPVLMPSVALGLSLLYSALALSKSLSLWPPHVPTLTLELLNYALGLLAFIWAIILVVAPHSRSYASILRVTRKYLPSFIQCTITLATLQWFSTLAR